MTEFGFIDHIKELFAALPDNGFEGIGDDCAVLPVGEGESLVFTTDMLAEGVHFLRPATSPRELGRKSLAVNLSDVASMGARPVATLLSLSLPADTAGTWAEEFMLGYRELSEEFGVTLAGGDTTRSAAGITINVTAIGVVVGLGSKTDGFVREDHFVITVASEIMAILCLATDLEDLKDRLGKIIVAYDLDGKPVTAKDLQAVGAMAALLKDAILPNVIQTLEHTPALVHGGPFANIAHGCNSVRATTAALSMADYVVTEAGFGADLGAEKFFDIKCRQAGLSPDAVVLVATIRALKYNGGVPKAELSAENVEALEKGIVNLE